MSKGKQTQNTSSTQNINGTSTPIVPDWISTAVQGITKNIGQLGSANPQSYVAGSTPLIDHATGAAGMLSGSPWDFSGAADLARGVAGAKAPDIASLMSKFTDPWENNVVNSTLADFDHSAGQTRAQDDLNLARSGAFGGSGAALTKAATEDALARARATTESGLRSQGFTQALGGATSQAGVNQNQNQQRMQAAGLLDQLATDYDANNRANIGAQLGAGAVQRGIAQDQLSAPLNLASWESSTLPDLLRSFFGTSTQGTTTSTQHATGSSNPGTLSSLGDIAAIASLFASDRRLKRDIVKLGELPNGLGIYLYRYLWSPILHAGVMAQEVLKVKPEAVTIMPSGFYAVDYGRL